MRTSWNIASAHASRRAARPRPRGAAPSSSRSTHRSIGPGEAWSLNGIQVKTALSLTRQGFAVARMSFPDGKPRQHRGFVYAIVYVVAASVEAAWIVPSADFNRLTYRGAGRRGKGLELQFMASPTRQDRWSAFRCARMDLGPKLIALIDSLPTGRAPRVQGAHLLLRRV